MAWPGFHSQVGGGTCANMERRRVQTPKYKFGTGYLKNYKKIAKQSAARRQIVGGGGGGAPTNKCRRRRRGENRGGGGAARPAQGSNFRLDD